MPRLLPLAAALGWAIALAVFLGSSATPRTEIPTPVAPPPPAFEEAFAQDAQDAAPGPGSPEQTLPDAMRAQRPTVDVGGEVVGAEPVDAEVTVEISEEEGVPVEVSPSEPEAEPARGPAPAEQDSDNDYVPDLVDNCPMVSNVGQEDGDGDGVGDACPVSAAQDEPRPGASDYDGDGITDESDNCWRLPNPTQKDGDGDGLGNGCDEGSAPFADDAPENASEPVAETPPPSEARTNDADPPERAGAGDDGERQADEGTASEREPTPTATEPSTTAAPAAEPPAPERTADDGRADRTEGADETPAPGSADPPSKVQAERPSDDPNSAERAERDEPSLPSRDTKRRAAEPGEFAVVARIDAGAIGAREEDGERSGRDTAGRPSQGNADGNRQRKPDADGGDERDGAQPDSDAGPPGSRSTAGRRGPVPIEAGAIIPNEASPAKPSPDSTARSDRDVGGAGNTAEAAGAGLVRGTVLAQTASADGDDEPGDGGAESGSDRRGEADPKPKEAVEPGPPWSADRGYRGGEATRMTDGREVAGTAEDDLFLTQRAGADGDRSGFVYTIPVKEDGVYRIRLFFAETWFGAPGGPKGRAGERIFDVDVEGEPALRDFDIYDEAGAMEAVVETLDVEVDDGKLEIEFRSVKDRPVVSAIEVLRPVPADRDRDQSERDDEASERDRSERDDQEQEREDEQGDPPAAD